MARLLFICPDVDPARWRAAFARHLPELGFQVWPDETSEPAEIDFALAWRPPPSELRRYRRLRAIFSLGAGVDELLREADLPEGVPLVRLVDPALTELMVEYVVHRVIHHHRGFARYAAQQREGIWRRIWPGQTREKRVGVMGLGVLGGAAARALAGLGFPVAGWSRTPHGIPGMEVFHGESGLLPFLGRSEILVCLLPLTPLTAGILNARTLAALPAGACLINVARGEHLVEEDLLDALASGQVAAATLDVFRREPLPPEHPFWRHPQVTITPHVASLTNAHTATGEIATDIRRLLAGQPPRHVVDAARGY